MRHDVVRRRQAFAVPRIGDERDRSVVLVADDAPRQVLARQLAAVEVERVAVAVVRRKSKQRDAAVILDPAPLTVVRNVAEDEIPADAVPRRPFEPQASGPEPLNRRVRLDEAIERRIDRQDVRVVEVHVRRRVRAEVARRSRHGRRAARAAARMPTAWPPARRPPHQSSSSRRAARRAACSLHGPFRHRVTLRSERTYSSLRVPGPTTPLLDSNRCAVF